MYHHYLQKLLHLFKIVQSKFKLLLELYSINFFINSDTVDSSYEFTLYLTDLSFRGMLSEICSAKLLD